MRKSEQMYESLKKGFFGIFVERIEASDESADPMVVSEQTAEAYARLLASETSTFIDQVELKNQILAAKEYANSRYEELETRTRQDIERILKDANNSLQRTQDIIQEADNRLSYEYGSALERIAAAETRISQAELDIDEAEATISLITEVIDPETGILTGAKIVVDGQAATLESFAEAVNTATGDITVLDSRMDAAEGTITTLAEWKNVASGEIHAMEEQWNTIDATITTTIATALSDETSAVYTGVSTIADGIAGEYKIEAVQEVWDEMDDALDDPSNPGSHSLKFAQFVVGVNGVRSEVTSIEGALDDPDNPGTLIQVSSIIQDVNSIDLRVVSTETALEDPDNPGTLLNVGSIKVKADEIDILVDNNGNVKAGIIVQAINAQTEGSTVLIDADKILLTGQVIADKITAGAGTNISGWTFGTNSISNGNVTLDSYGNIFNQAADAAVPSWHLDASGAGGVANNHITWGSDGTTVIDGSVLLVGTSVATLVNSQFFTAEVLASDDILVKLKSDYPFFKPGKGLIFDANAEANTNVDFEKVALPGGGYALHSKLPFYSDSFISAGGLSDGDGASGITWAALAAPTSEQINLSHLTGALGGYYTKAQVDALIGGISGFSYEIYPSLSSVTDPKSNILYLIGPTGTGTDKYEEYVYSNNAWTKIGDTSIDLSGYVQHADLLPLAEAIAANDLRIRSFEDWLLNPSFDDLTVYSLSAQELNLGGYLFDGEGIDRAISLAGSAIQPADLKQLTFQSGAFSAVSYNPASPATVNIPSSIAHLTDANRVSTLEGRFDANGKLTFASLPALYIGTTRVQASSAEQALTGITTGAFSSYITAGSYVRSANYLFAGYGNAPSTSEAANIKERRRIYFGSTDYYIELDENGYLHANVGFYSDSFISAGGLSTGEGGEGATLDAVWASLTANSDEFAGRKIDLNHLPYTAGAGISITNGIISATNAGAVTSIKLGTTTYGPVSGVVSLPAYPTTLPASDVYDWAKAATKPSYAFSEITGTLAVTQVPTIPISKTLGLEAALAAKMDLDSELPLTEGIATNDRRIASLEDWLLNPSFDALSVYSLDAAEISLAGDMLGDYLTGLSDDISAEAQARSDADDTINGAITTLASRTTTLEGYFTGGSAKSAQTAARLSGNASYTAWGQTYWSNGVPGSISGDITSVGSISMNGAISGATTISASVSVTSPKFYLNANTYFEVDSNGYVHLVHPSGKGFYADGFISAGGVSSGGGASGIDLAAMWSSLTNATSDPYANYKIAAAHIPDMASTYGYATQTWVGQQGYLTSASLSGYATQSWVNSQGFVTSSGVTSVGLSAPTGFSVTGSPVTSSGTLALAFASGYSLPTTAKQNLWDTAYGWGNHASQGYLKATTAASTYETIASANLSELSLAEGISSNEDRLTALEGWLASPALNELLVRSFGADEVETGRLLAESASISAISLAGADLATTLSGFALKTTTVNGTGYLTGGGDLSANRTIDIASTYKTRIDNGNTAYGWGNHASAGYLTASEAANTYVTLSTAQTISGAKTFSATLYGADSEWSDGRSTLRLIAANGYTYIQSSSAAHDASADMYLTGLYGGVGSYLYLRFSNVHAYSNIVADGAITAGSASARELKQNIKPMSRERALDIVMNTNPVTFEWNALATSLYDKLSGADIGLIAQEIEPYVPSAIGTIFEKYKRLDYTKLIAPILCVEKDHERRIAALERENEKLRKRLNMN